MLLFFLTQSLNLEFPSKGLDLKPAACISDGCSKLTLRALEMIHCCRRALVEELQSGS